jgi:hypothetical protein
MEFHGFFKVGDKHFVDITDYGKRKRVEVTAQERASIERRQGTAYGVGVQDGYRGRIRYSTPFLCSFMGEAWARGVSEGQRRKKRG